MIDSYTSTKYQIRELRVRLKGNKEHIADKNLEDELKGKTITAYILISVLEQQLTDAANLLRVELKLRRGEYTYDQVSLIDIETLHFDDHPCPEVQKRLGGIFVKCP